VKISLAVALPIVTATATLLATETLSGEVILDAVAT